ncbi:MAG TPA: hypothetical protein VEH78_04940 [Pseudolabrys sp.]|nr:hypothetical protein [Pseudolabrys sp.]
MSTLQVHTRAVHPVSGFARVTSLLKTLLELLIDARREAAAAQKRYPFAEW